MRKRGSRDNKLQSRKEPGRETNEKQGGSSRLRRYSHADLVSTKLNRQAKQAIINKYDALLIYIDSGIYHIPNVFVNRNFVYENTTAKQASVC